MDNNFEDDIIIDDFLMVTHELEAIEKGETD